MDGTAVAQLLSWHILTAEIVASTSEQGRPAMRNEQHWDRTFQAAPAFANAGPTALQENYVFPSSDRPEERVVAEIRSYATLLDGWDGEFATKPECFSIESASNFVRLLGRSASSLEPTLHADGSIILEAEDGAMIRFLDGSQISAVLPGFSGTIEFDGTAIPPAILRALEA